MVPDSLVKCFKRRVMAEAMRRSKCEFHGQTRAKAEAKLNEWKKANARAVSISSDSCDALNRLGRVCNPC
jgi:hypothetical protein